MLEPWFLYSVIASICVGCFGFAQKIKAEYSERSDTGFIVYVYFVFFLSGLGLSIFFGDISSLYNPKLILGSFGIMFLYTIVIKTRLRSLRYISSSSYFINYRIFSSLWLLMVGIIFFSESISLNETLGIFLGFVIFYILLEKNDSQSRKQDIKKGLIYLFIGSVCITGLQAINKTLALGDSTITPLIFWSGIFGIIFSLCLKGKQPLTEIFKLYDLQYKVFLCISGAIFVVGIYANIIALESGDLAIVYKIISYSLFIPIILSIIFYKETVTPRKIFAFILTFLSIFLFI